MSIKQGKPTKGEVREFWEWCGLKFVQCDCVNPGLYNHSHVEDSNGYIIGKLPPIDLNSLFKYAIPKMAKGHEIRLIIPPNTIDRFIAYIGHNNGIENKDPALALFWAIYNYAQIGV